MTKIMYQKIGLINRPILRPVLQQLPVGLVDLQALPPSGWCCRCGGEVYQKETALCADCEKTETEEYQ